MAKTQSKERSIFEDVSEASPKQREVKIRDNNPKSVRIWLWILLALVFVMILVGGATRLTDSGLSITEWDLVMGTLPPMNPTDWDALFAKYQTTQEYQLQNAGMSLDQFKSIFWWEWGHRFLGRIIGAVWIIGFLIFWLRGSIRKDRLGSIFGLGLLIGLQGAIGWWMVASGLVGNRTDVASYRLAVHLGMAFIILGVIYWNIKLLSKAPAELVEARRRGSKSGVSWSKLIAGFVFLQIILGALVAGIDAGRSYTDWPLMGGEFFSSDSFIYEPIWRNFFESAALVQFMHRMNAYLILVLVLIFMFKQWRAPYKQWRSLSRMMVLAILLQIIIGIGVLYRMAALLEALTHQAFAMGIWILALGMVFAFRYPRVQKIQ